MYIHLYIAPKQRAGALALALYAAIHLYMCVYQYVCVCFAICMYKCVRQHA